MIALLCFVLTVLAAPFKSKSRLEAENAALGRPLSIAPSRTGSLVPLNAVSHRSQVLHLNIVHAALGSPAPRKGRHDTTHGDWAAGNGALQQCHAFIKRDHILLTHRSHGPV
jgi:hypothetical protein